MNTAIRNGSLPTLLAGMLALLLGAAGCQPKPPPTSNAVTPAGSPVSAPGESDVKAFPQTVLPEQEGKLSPTVVSASTEFGFKLLSMLCESQPDENVFVSPISISTALAMTYNGAVGETAEAMARTLELTGVDLSEINKTNAYLLRSLTDQGAVNLHLANALWEVQGVFREEFLSTNEQFYKATVKQVTQDTYVDAINAWVQEHTRGRIQEAISEPTHGLTVPVVLGNVAYFLGRWADEFDPGDTHDAPFTLLDGEQKTVPLMRQHGPYEHLKTDELQAVRIPYEGGRFAMYIALPATEDGIGDLAASMNADRWQSLRDQLSPQELTLYMPRFRMSWGADLVGSLKAMGMGVACGSDADFSRMIQGGDGSWIERVLHNTFIQVNETGTEAAAATIAEVAAGEMPVVVQMRVDHPFMCAIRDDETGVVLFAGVIVDPQ